MQRLLRSGFLYVCLGAVLLLLYLPSSRSKDHAIDVTAPATPAHVSDSALALEVQPLNPELLRQVGAKAPAITMLLSLLGGLAVGLGVGGLALTMWAVWTGRIGWFMRGASAPLPQWTMGDIGRIIGLLVFIAGCLPFARVGLLAMMPTWSIDHTVWMTGSMLLLDVCALLVVLVFAGRRRLFVVSVGDRRGTRHHLWQACATGLLGYVVLFPWLFLLLASIVAMARAFGFQPPMEPIQEMIFQEQRPAILGLTTLLACVIGPLAEEAIFRGVLYATLRRWLPRVVAVLISGVVFALIHTNPIGFIPIMLLGCLLAEVYERTGSLLTPLVVHVVHNTFLISVALAYRALLSAIHSVG